MAHIFSTISWKRAPLEMTFVDILFVGLPHELQFGSSFHFWSSANNTSVLLHCQKTFGKIPGLRISGWSDIMPALNSSCPAVTSQYCASNGIRLSFPLCLYRNHPPTFHGPFPFQCLPNTLYHCRCLPNSGLRSARGFLRSKKADIFPPVSIYQMGLLERRTRSGR